MELDGRVTLVTGGSRGLGKAIAQTLLSGGAHVALTGREPAVLRQAVDELRADCPRPDQAIIGIEGDVALAEDVNRTVAEVRRALGRLDVLVCNAGVYGPLGRI